MKKLFTLAAVAAMMFSCSKSEDVTPDAAKLPINISIGLQTRATDTTFESGDEVGIYVVNYDGSTAGSLKATGNQVDNMRFTMSDSKWTPDETIYWKDKTTAADFYAYYPYSASPNISAHPFAVKADQSEDADFWASDFLWGKTNNVSPTSSAVPIETNHSLSRILVDVVPSEGFADAWGKAAVSVKICDVKTSATIDLATGVATATGNNGEIIPLAAAKTGTTLSYQAMMIPQVVADNSKLVVVTVDGVDYVYRKGFTFKANTQHKFTITVNKSGSSVDVTIGEWEMDENINEGNAEEEVTTAETIPNNQIWYTTKDGNILNIDDNQFNVAIKSNTYENGKGIIVFEGDVTTMSCVAFHQKVGLVSVSLPDCLTKFDETYRYFYELYYLTEINSKFSTEDKRCLVVNGKLLAFAPSDIGDVYSIQEGVESIVEYLFANNARSHDLQTIIIPESVISIEDNAFIADHINIFYFRGTTPPTIGDDIFGDIDNSLKIYVPTASVEIYKEEWSEYADYIYADPTEN